MGNSNIKVVEWCNSVIRGGGGKVSEGCMLYECKLQGSYLRSGMQVYYYRTAFPQPLIRGMYGLYTEYVRGMYGVSWVRDIVICFISMGQIAEHK